MGDRHDFVKIFLEQGFSLEEFLTVYMLERLYTDQLKNMVSICFALHLTDPLFRAPKWPFSTKCGSTIGRTGWVHLVSL